MSIWNNGFVCRDETSRNNCCHCGGCGCNICCCQGAQGPQGLPGPIGPAGPQGPPGPGGLRNLVDGNAPGSVRGIDTAAGYTMGIDAMAIGRDTTTSGDASFAQGTKSTASGNSAVALGLDTVSSADASFAQGLNSVASGNYAVAISQNTIASGVASFAQGIGTVASGDYAVAEGERTTARGEASHAEGFGTEATTGGSHAEGRETLASGESAHTEGTGTVASGRAAHAEGLGTHAANTAAHAEGVDTIAEGNSSHAEGFLTIASGNYSHAEGGGTTAVGDYSHAEGADTTAGNIVSHAEGFKTTAAAYAHAEGDHTSANSYASHTEGGYTVANGDYAHAQNYDTIAQNFYQTAMGRYNAPSNLAQNTLQTDDALIIGNGSPAARSNAFRVQFTGDVHSASGVYTTGADYAEMFEWQDGNPVNEDRRGYFVTVAKGYIRKATARDRYILGVVSIAPSMIGDAQSLGWQGMYLRDDWGAILYEWEDEQREVPDNDPAAIKAWREACMKGGMEAHKPGIPTKMETHRVQHPKLNPAYDPNRRYQPRAERLEWTAVGIMGKLLVRDDGSCLEDGFCRPDDDGAATVSEQGYLVLKRLGANKVLILLDGPKLILA